MCTNISSFNKLYNKCYYQQRQSNANTTGFNCIASGKTHNLNRFCYATLYYNWSHWQQLDLYLRNEVNGIHLFEEFEAHKYFTDRSRTILVNTICSYLNSIWGDYPPKHVVSATAIACVKLFPCLTEVSWYMCEKNYSCYNRFHLLGNSAQLQERWIYRCSIEVLEITQEKTNQQRKPFGSANFNSDRRDYWG